MKNLKALTNYWNNFNLEHYYKYLNSMEIYKVIEGYEDYQISNYGNIKSFRFKKERILKPGIDGAGYLKVSLFKDRKAKTKNVHQLVAIAFLNHKPNGLKGLVVDHIDNDKHNNNLENLQLINHRENVTKEKKGFSGYTGVSWNKKNKKWVSTIFYNGKSIHLGYFTSEEEASEKYKNKLKQLEK